MLEIISLDLELTLLFHEITNRAASVFISVTRKLMSRPRSNAHCTRVTLNHSVRPPK